MLIRKNIYDNNHILLHTQRTSQYVVHTENKHKLSKHSQETMNLPPATIKQIKKKYIDLSLIKCVSVFLYSFAFHQQDQKSIVTTD